MKKQFILTVIAVIVLLGVIVVIRAHQTADMLPSTATSTVSVSTTTATVVSNPSFLAGQALEDEAWGIFQKYLTAAKNHDLPTLTSLSYQISATCKDPKQQATCYGKMDDIYTAGKVLQEKDFTHIVSDNKQLIIYTDWTQARSDILTSVQRSLIYFTRNSVGTPQVLWITPSELEYTGNDGPDGKPRTPAQISAQIKLMTADTDGDTIDDQVETCSDAGVTNTCVKTDPTKKDSDGNGWWDSIQQFFY
jgi:hypothetical protein